MMDEKKEEVTSPSVGDVPLSAPIPVDREWIAKLLKKHPNPNSVRQDGKALVVAPMVDQSDLPFRLLARKYGSNLCFTPMIHSRLLVDSKAYRSKFLIISLTADRPLIAQLCGSEPKYVLEAARYLEPYVDGIDINCGCPQGIARRGNYGAFLLEQEETLLTLVKHLLKHLKVPLSVKVRLLPPPNANNLGEDPSDHSEKFDIPKHSLELYTKLVDAGIHLLTVHGRTRHEKAHHIGETDWDTIRKAVELLGDRIPIFANGSIETYEDVEECLRITGADGIMSSEAVLEYPPIFYVNQQLPVRSIGRIQLAKEYMALARQYPPHLGGQGSLLKCIRVHIHRFLHADLQANTDLRTLLVSASSLDALDAAIELCQKYHDEHDLIVSEESMSWYLRHRGGDGPEGEATPANASSQKEEDEYEEEQAFCGLFGTADADY
jgi:tRNA-dihydrouridine synthase 1